MDSNKVSLCNGTNYDNYIEIGIKGLEPDIVYICISKHDCTSLINCLTYLTYSVIYPHILSFPLVPFPLQKYYISGSIIISDTDFTISILDTSYINKEYKIEYNKGELENIQENIIFYFCETIKE